MGEVQRPLAILFADLGGSMRLYDTLGDATAQRITSRCLALISEVVERHGGVVIKTIGDEVMATFDEAGQAALAAIEILACIHAAGDVHEGRLGVHVGFHVGPVIRERGDVFGDAVNVAARMVALAVDGEVLTTREGADALPAELVQRARPIDRRAVDGKREALEVFQLAEESPDRTSMVAIPVRSDAGRVLVLESAGRRWRVDDAHPALTIGRAAETDRHLGAALPHRGGPVAPRRPQLRRPSAPSSAPQTVSTTFTRAWRLSLAGTIVHGACEVLVRSTISFTASSYSSHFSRLR
jgi:adenylate cyclase